jgi:hypothetical protein
MAHDLIKEDLVALVQSYFETQLNFVTDLAEFRWEAQKVEHYIVPPTNYISEARTCTLETKLDN